MSDEFDRLKSNMRRVRENLMRLRESLGIERPLLRIRRRIRPTYEQGEAKTIKVGKVVELSQTEEVEEGAPPRLIDEWRKHSVLASIRRVFEESAKQVELETQKQALEVEKLRKQIEAEEKAKEEREKVRPFVNY